MQLTQLFLHKTTKLLQKYNFYYYYNIPFNVAVMHKYQTNLQQKKQQKKLLKFILPSCFTSLMFYFFVAVAIFHRF